jgi:hypothetical protein
LEGLPCETMYIQRMAEVKSDDFWLREPKAPTGIELGPEKLLRLTKCLSVPMLTARAFRTPNAESQAV